MNILQKNMQKLLEWNMTHPGMERNLQQDPRKTEPEKNLSI